MVLETVYRCVFHAPWNPAFEHQTSPLHQAHLSTPQSLFALGHLMRRLVAFLVLFCSWWSIRAPFCKKPTAFKTKMGYVPVVALLLRFIQFHFISSWVNGHSEVMAMLVGNILFQYRSAVKCQKLLVLLSQFPRQRMSATCQASHMRWIL